MNSQSVPTLIVDPDPSWQAVFQQCLSAARGAYSYQIAPASTLAEARDVLTRMTPRFIIVDFDHLDTEVFTFIRQVRTTPATSNSVIVCITTHRSAQEKVAAFQAGADHYYVKPINLDTFVMSYPLLKRLHKQ